MKKKLISIVAIASLGGSAFAADRAVESLHYQAGLEARYFDYESEDYYGSVFGTTQIDTGLNGEVTLPVGQYFGVSLGAGIALSSAEDDAGTFKAERETTRGIAQLFFRNPSKGRVSIGYGYERVQSDYTSHYYGHYEYSDTYSNDSYLALVEGYIGPVTLALRGERLNLDALTDPAEYTDTVWASAQWYVDPSVRIGLQVGGADAEDSYIAEVEFQPGFLGDTAGIFIGYQLTEQDAVKINAYRIGFNLYFDKRFDLQTRDRHYR